MKLSSQRIIHAGINFVVVPPHSIDHNRAMQFQEAILEQGLDFFRVENYTHQIAIIRQDPSPLHISVILPENQPVGQILVLSPHPKTAYELFIQEAEAAISAYEAVWVAPNRQIIQSDCTVRALYETTSPHAFQELWEERLGQPTQSLAAFARPIRGGGLRFVMDPTEEDPVKIEVKIESFLRDTTQIFIETQCAWLNPTNPGDTFPTRANLEYIESYINEQVHTFLSGEVDHDAS